MRTKIFEPEVEIENICTWIKNYFVENGPNSKAVIGISGGKDSTITATLLVRALGPERVIGVMMPNGEQSDIADSIRVCELLGIKNYTINIKNTYQNLTEDFINHTNLALTSQIETNTPSRLRMTTLYMVAAAVNGRVVGTTNESEWFIGYFTKWGDSGCDFAPLKWYTVSEVLQIGDALGLPYDLVHKTPSDGMCGKSDEEQMGITYEEIDDYLHNDGLGLTEETYNKIEAVSWKSFHKHDMAPGITDYFNYLED